MRHQKKGFKLNRTKSHRKATLAAMSSSLIKHKRITTTTTKARALRVFVEPLITRAKTDTTHNRREVFKLLQDKHAIKELFGEVAEKVGDRPGGYTRVIKLGQRSGDSAPMAMIELVDYNDVRPEGSSSTKKKTRRGRKRGGGKKAAAGAAGAGATRKSSKSTKKADEVVEVAEPVEDVVDSVDDAVDAAENAVEAVDEAVDDAVEEAVEVADDVADAAKEAVADAAEAATDAAENIVDDVEDAIDGDKS